MLSVFIIEDNQPYLKCLMEYLNQCYVDNDINIHCFSDSQQAEIEIINERPDVIITDQGMPMLDGSTLIENVKKVYSPVTILHSAIPMLHNHEFDYVLKKPIDLRKIPETIDIIVKSFEIEEIKKIEQVVDELENISYHDRLMLRNMIYKIKNIDTREEIKYCQLTEAANKEKHTLMMNLKKIKDKNKIRLENKDFIFNLVKKVRGLNDK